MDEALEEDEEKLFLKQNIDTIPLFTIYVDEVLR